MIGQQLKRNDLDERQQEFEVAGIGDNVLGEFADFFFVLFAADRDDDAGPGLHFLDVGQRLLVTDTAFFACPDHGWPVRQPAGSHQ